jgi:hypothetical protein
MSYQSRADRPLEQDETFHAREYLGRVRAADYPASVEKILAGLEPPRKQRVFSAAKIVYVRCEADRTVYEDDEEVHRVDGGEGYSCDDSGWFDPAWDGAGKVE